MSTGETSDSSSRWQEEALPSCRNLVVTGTANEAQLLEMLRRYSERPSYVMKALNDLFALIRSMTTPRIDIIQLAVTACLYDLSKAKTGEKC